MRLELEDFTPLAQIEEKREEIQERSKEGKESSQTEDLRKFYEQKIKELENQYKELINQVSKESYEKAFEDAKKEYEERLREQIEKIVEEKEREKEISLAQSYARLQSMEKALFEKYARFIEEVTDLIVDSVSQILEFLYIDESNKKRVVEAIEKVLEDFGGYMPFTIEVAPTLYNEVERYFHSINVKENKELGENEFIVEFQNFKIENTIKEKLNVLKDEIKREIRKIT